MNGGGGGGRRRGGKGESKEKGVGAKERVRDIEQRDKEENCSLRRGERRRRREG